jgi:YfiH family protein
MITLHQAGPVDHCIEWYTSTTLSVPHAMLRRRGGHSASPFASLNLSYGVGDRPEAVEANRQRIKQQFKIDLLASAVQVHGDRIIQVDEISTDTEFEHADALLTSQAGVGLMIQQADCQAILLHDPVQNVIGAVHSGWQGSTCNIIGKTVAQMEQAYGVNPARLKAVISPSLGPCCGEFIHYERELPRPFHVYQTTVNHFDFWKISQNQLACAGLLKKNIDTAGICTSCNAHFFSYRRAQKRQSRATGRNGSLIVMEQVLPAESLIEKA